MRTAKSPCIQDTAVDYGARLLTLSTCYDNGEARIIVVAGEARPSIPFYPFRRIMN